MILVRRCDKLILSMYIHTDMMYDMCYSYISIDCGICGVVHFSIQFFFFFLSLYSFEGNEKYGLNIIGGIINNNNKKELIVYALPQVLQVH